MKKTIDHHKFCKALLAWFRLNQRDLPWRQTYAPYHVWISEIMLQQTQMDRVVDYFKRWMDMFPDIEILSHASEQSVLKAWEGLGYYTRARNIIETARLLVHQYQGRIPDDHEQLLALPGIGPYTAGAIMSIAFDRPHTVVDANVERLFARICDIKKPMKEKAVRQKLVALLETMVNNEGVSPRYFNQGLMELGALICTPKNPDCDSCPVCTDCWAYAAGTVAERPVKKQKQKTVDIVMACVIIRKKGDFFIQQRKDDDVWGGLWEFPGGRLKKGESPAEAAKRELLEETELLVEEQVPYATVTHYYTKYRVTLHSFLCRVGNATQPKLHAAQQYKWVSLDELSQFAFPSGHRQLIGKLRKDV